jgi:hypothetical protein
MVRDLPNLGGLGQQMVKVPTPPGGIFPYAVTTDASPIEDRFDTSAHPARRFRDGFP